MKAELTQDQILSFGRWWQEQKQMVCRCGHLKLDHKQMWDEGRPTSHFPCATYGCVCGIFETLQVEETK